MVKDIVSTQSGHVSLKVVIASSLAGLTLVVLIFAFWNARAQAANEIRVADLTRIQEALKIYSDENGRYPSGSGVPSGIEEYLDFWPTPPSFSKGQCGKSNDVYSYSQKSLGDDYSITFCLSQKTNGIPAGVHALNSRGLQK